MMIKKTKPPSQLRKPIIKPTYEIAADGAKVWYLKGTNKLHRTDGPAVIRKDGTQEWYINDKLHREDGPAVIYPDGTKEWYINGKLHREDGPAVERADGTKEWYLNGVYYPPDSE